MELWNYAVRIYYSLKTYYDAYFKTKNDLLYSKEKKVDDPKIIELDSDLKKLYYKIDIKYIYNCLYIINKDYNENSGVKEIIEFLEEEAQFILQNKDNLEPLE